MKILLMHMSFPSQYEYLLEELCRNPENQIVFLAEKIGKEMSFPNLTKIIYDVYIEEVDKDSAFLQKMVEHSRASLAAKKIMLKLRNEDNFIPDIIMSHPGWGNMLFIRDVYPQTPIISYVEYYQSLLSGGLFYNPLKRIQDHDVENLRFDGATYLHAMVDSDFVFCPTHWQAAVIGKDFKDKLIVMHDGIDTDLFCPEPNARIDDMLGVTLADDAEIITHCARNFEPMRGFITVMKSLERILNERPKAHVVMVGGEEQGYEELPRGVSSWRALLEQHTNYDRNRVHWLGKVDYDAYRKVLQCSDVHIYLTVPSVLSWSFTEAMAVGCNIVSSATPPIMEVIKDGYNGLLVDFHAPLQLANMVCKILANKEEMQYLGQNARKTIEAKYSHKKIMPLYVKLIEQIASGQKNPMVKKEIAELNPAIPEFDKLKIYSEYI